MAKFEADLILEMLSIDFFSTQDVTVGNINVDLGVCLPPLSAMEVWSVFWAITHCRMRMTSYVGVIQDMKNNMNNVSLHTPTDKILDGVESPSTWFTLPGRGEGKAWE